MAESKTPKHDFAPAWLKLPSPDIKSKQYSSDKSAVSDSKNSSPRVNKNNTVDVKRSVRSRRDSAGFIFRSYDRYDSLQRQRDNYQDNVIRYGNKSRHLSVEDYYTYHYGNSYNGHTNGQYTPQARSSKYHQPNSRFTKQQLINMSYCDMYSYDFYSGEPYYGYSSSRHKHGSNHQDRDSTRHLDKQASTPEPNFNDEFPSLNGQDGDKNVSSNRMCNHGGVWDKPPRKKLVSSETPVVTDKDSPSKMSSSFRVLVSSKVSSNRYNVLPKKSSLRINGMHQDSSLISKPIKTIPSSQPIEIVHPCLHTHTRNKGNKSEFLQTLRSSNSPTDNKSPNGLSPSSCDELMNGVDQLNIDSEGHRLSSSVEAEQRLLREMGWSEVDDGEEYVITEAEMKEFHSRTAKQLPDNGVVRSLNRTWSNPTHPFYSEEEQKGQVSSTDSDDSC